MKTITFTSFSSSSTASLHGEASQIVNDVLRPGGIDTLDAFTDKVLLRASKWADDQRAESKVADFLEDQVRFAMSEGGAIVLSSTLKQLRGARDVDAASILETGASAYMDRIARRPKDQCEKWDVELRQAWLAHCPGFLADGRLSPAQYESVTRVLENEV